MLEEKLELFCKENNCIGISAVVADKNKILKDFYYGYASLEEDKETSSDTIYRMASVSKVVVATAVLMLYDKGLVDLDEDISKYLGYTVRNPYFPDDIITIKMLMTQTSSLSDSDEEVVGYDGVNMMTSFVDLKRLLTDPSYEYYTNKTYLNVKPGTVWHYSNFGCGILACILEKVTGTYFTDFVNEHIFHKLGLDASFRVDEIKKQDKVASLYILKNNEFSLRRDVEKFREILFPRYKLGNNFRGPAGGMFISLKDLSKFMMCLMNEDNPILKKDTIKLMRTVFWSDPTHYGLYQKKGLQLLILDINDTTLYGHTGEAYGLRSFMLFNSDYGYLFACNGARFKMALEDFSLVQKQFLNEMMNYTKELK